MTGWRRGPNPFPGRHERASRHSRAATRAPRARSPQPFRSPRSDGPTWKRRRNAARLVSSAARTAPGGSRAPRWPEPHAHRAAARTPPGGPRRGRRCGLRRSRRSAARPRGTGGGPRGRRRRGGRRPAARATRWPRSASASAATAGDAVVVGVARRGERLERGVGRVPVGGLRQPEAQAAHAEAVERRVRGGMTEPPRPPKTVTTVTRRPRSSSDSSRAAQDSRTSSPWGDTYRLSQPSIADRSRAMFRGRGFGRLASLLRGRIAACCR